MIEIFQNNLSQFLIFGSRFLLLTVIFKTLGVIQFSELSFLITLVVTYGQAMTFGSMTYIMNLKENEAKNSLKILIFLFLITFPFLGFVLNYYFDFIYEIIAITFTASVLYGANLILVTSEKRKGNYLTDIKVSIIQSSVISLLCIALVVDNLEIVEVMMVLNFGYFLCLLSNLKILINVLVENIHSARIIDTERSYFGFQDLVYLIYSNGLVLLLYNFMDSIDYGHFRAILLIFLPIGVMVFAISQVVIGKYNELKEKINIVVLILIISISIFYWVFKSLVFDYSGIQITTELSFVYDILIVYSIFNVINMKFSIVLVVKNLQKTRFLNSLIVSLFIMTVLTILSVIDCINIYTGPALLTASFVAITLLNFRGTIIENRDIRG